MVVPNGKGGEEAMRLSLEDAKIEPGKIDYINLHGTFTEIGDTVEIEAIKNVFGANPPAFSSTKLMTGHELRAAGSQKAILCILMLQSNFMAPNINLEDPDPIVNNLPILRSTRNAEIDWVLSNLFGFGGTNCGLVFAHPDAV